ncbi:MAG: NYN domain-containing protein [Candidatus Thiodiazotropha sp. DIVDIV]
MITELIALKKKLNMQKTTILVDVQNIYYTTKQAYRQNFDYNSFWKKVSSNREVINAIAYTCDKGDQKQKQFQNILKAIGFEVKLKPYIQRSDGSAKCDWDVGITVDAMEYAAESDIIVLVSGDGDFDLLAKRLISAYSCFVEVYGVPQLTAASLINSASNYIPIEDSLLLSK